MPNLKFLHTRLNLDTPLDLEIYNGLTKYPEGERSKVVRLALLGYIKREVGREGKLIRRAKAKRPEPERNQGIGSAPKTAPTPLSAPVGEINESDSALENTQGPLPANSKPAINDLLNLVK